MYSAAAAMTHRSETEPDQPPACLSTFSSLETALELRAHNSSATVIAVYTEDDCK